MKEKRIKVGIIFLVILIIFVIVVTIGLRWYFGNTSSNEEEQVNKVTGEIAKEEEKDAIIEENISNEEIEKEKDEEELLPNEVLISGKSITLDEIFKDATNHQSKKDKVLEDENCLTDKNLNINGKGLGEEVDKSTINNINLTNKNDNINYKDMEKNNKVKTEENRSDNKENKVEDNTPSFDAEPEQKNPIIWEDGGEPMKKGEQQNANSGPTDGISTNGGILGTFDEEVPVIKGIKNRTIYIGDKVDYKNGVKVVDDCDGNITKNLKINSKNVNLKKAGKYKINYSATDKAGNKSFKNAIITVKIKKVLSKVS